MIFYVKLKTFNLKILRILRKKENIWIIRMVWNDFCMTKGLMDFPGWKRVTVGERLLLFLKAIRVNGGQRK